MSLKKKYNKYDYLYLDVLGCARCGEDHKNIEFYMFLNPVKDSDETEWNRWGDCPTTEDPILLRVEERHVPEDATEA